MSGGFARARKRAGLQTFHDFVEQALFNPRWGYYATGKVGFGDGGHFDTYPLALSPYFGAMVAGRARRVWARLGRPRRFEICEVGAGNGQLCLDTLATSELRARHDRRWREFNRALHYRIVEKSAALRRRQRQHLGPMSARVVWEALDLSRSRRRRRRGRHGLVVANEVLDCLAHHKVVLGRDRQFRVAYVRASRPGSGKLLSAGALDEALERGKRVRFEEVLLPAGEVQGLAPFLRRHHGDAAVRFTGADLPWTYYACPAIETFVRNLAALYSNSEICLIDYGGDAAYHRHTPAEGRISAGRPEEHTATLYRAPGRDDITFLVDFSVVSRAGQAAGLRLSYFGPQGRLAALGGVRLDGSARAKIVEHRTLRWLLAMSGVGPESRQKATALSWTKPRGGSRKTLAQEAAEAVNEFLGDPPSTFQLMVLTKRSAG
jgi:SAM-dependent MidA family methyltransferase